MIDLLSKKSTSGDLCINLAKQHLGMHEWGRAKMAIDEGLSKGHLSEPEKAFMLFEEICHRLGLPVNEMSLEE
jgi:hypothetical protein